VTHKGPRSERETVINFNKEEETETIWKASGKMDKRLRKLGLEVIEEGDRHTVFRCLKSQVKIRRQKVAKGGKIKKGSSPQTVRHAVERWLPAARYGVDISLDSPDQFWRALAAAREQPQERPAIETKALPEPTESNVSDPDDAD
jgi:hypothetical protein